MNSRSTSSPSFPLRQAEETGTASRFCVVSGFAIIPDSMIIQARSTRPAGVRLAPR